MAVRRWTMPVCNPRSPRRRRSWRAPGGLVIRPSGTEPVIRVMAEGDDAAQVEQVVDRICDAVKHAC